MGTDQCPTGSCRGGPVAATEWGRTMVLARGSTLDALPLSERIDRLREACASLSDGDAIVERIASISSAVEQHVLFTTEGERIEQELRLVDPVLMAVASDGSETQSRSLGARSLAGQGGLGRLERVGFFREGPRLAAQARELLEAPLCPEAT